MNGEARSCNRLPGLALAVRGTRAFSMRDGDSTRPWLFFLRIIGERKRLGTHARGASWGCPSTHTHNATPNKEFRLR